MVTEKLVFVVRNYTFIGKETTVFIGLSKHFDIGF